MFTETFDFIMALRLVWILCSCLVCWWVVGLDVLRGMLGIVTFL